MASGRALSVPAAGMAFFLGYNAALADRLDDKAKALCADRYPDGYSLQKLCFDNEIEGMNFTAIQSKQSQNYKDMAAHCMLRYHKGDTYQWSLVKLCFQNEIEAYKALNP